VCRAEPGIADFPSANWECAARETLSSRHCSGWPLVRIRPMEPTISSGYPAKGPGIESKKRLWQRRWQQFAWLIAEGAIRVFRWQRSSPGRPVYLAPRRRPARSGRAAGADVVDSRPSRCALCYRSRALNAGRANAPPLPAALDDRGASGGFI
jgi:hypothetical protein